MIIKGKKMFKNKFIIVTFVIMAVLAISAFSWISIARSEESQNSLTGDLSSFDAAEASAYRWNAMAKFYDARNESQSSLTGDLSSFDAAEASAYRWNAMAEFYDARNESQSSLTGDLSSFDAAEASVYRWNAMAEFYDARNESQSSLTGDLSSFDPAQVKDLTALKTSNIVDYRFVPIEPGFWSRQGPSLLHNTTTVADYRFVAIEPGFWARQAAPAILEMAEIS